MLSPIQAPHWGWIHSRNAVIVGPVTKLSSVQSELRRVEPRADQPPQLQSSMKELTSPSYSFVRPVLLQYSEPGPERRTTS